MKAIMHAWPKEERELMMDAVNAFGFGGVVTNPPHAKIAANGCEKESGHFYASPENVAELGRIVDELKARELSYWIYDEEGYPSGYAAGRTLKGHSEYEAKGFYMYRRSVYTPTDVHYALDECSEKIVFAAKYVSRVEGNFNCGADYRSMTPVPFTEKEVNCFLSAFETLYVFCVKSAYEGSQCTHNTYSFDHQINLMDMRAVRHFIDLVYEPIASGIPEAFRDAVAIFTDEPSLMTCYTSEEESWPYALMPWVDGIFDEFEKEYGYSLLPHLPLLFEGGTQAYAVRTQFYRLVGKLVARAYTGQLSAFCREHGGRFSGHYLGEELLEWHVRFYGSFIEVLKATDRVGVDILRCHPERYTFNTPKFAQMALRKKGERKLMTEFCPFAFADEFYRDPVNNAMATVGLLYLGGTREITSYYRADFEQYSPLLEAMASRGEDTPPNGKRLPQKDALMLNEYTARLGFMLDGLINEPETFIYYPLEDVQATAIPLHTYNGDGTHPTDVALKRLCDTIYERGHDYAFLDDEDLVRITSHTENGVFHDGCPVRTVIVPASRVIYRHSHEAFDALRRAGVTVLYAEAAPQYTITLDDTAVTPLREENVQTLPGILSYLDRADVRFTAKAENSTILKARYTTHTGEEMYFVVNNTRGHDAEVIFTHEENACASLYDPMDGSVREIRMGESTTIASFRGVFIVFDRK